MRRGLECDCVRAARGRLRRVRGRPSRVEGRAAWALLCVAGLVVVLLLFKWAARPVGRAGTREDEFRNEATNRAPPPTPSPADSHAGAKPSDGPREDKRQEAGTPATEESGGRTEDDTQGGRVAPGVSEGEEAASFSVQAGAFEAHSQANELVSRLRAAGFDARVVEAEASKRFRFQVRSGLFRTREEAAPLRRATALQRHPDRHRRAGRKEVTSDE